MKKLRMADKSEAEEDSGETGDSEKGNLTKDRTMQKRILRKVVPSKKRKESPERVRTMLLVLHSTMYTARTMHMARQTAIYTAKYMVTYSAMYTLMCTAMHSAMQTSSLPPIPGNHRTVFCTSTAVRALPVVDAAYIHS